MTRSRFTGDVGYRAYKKNYLINGNMDVWQRGTNFSSGNEYTADRFYASLVAPTTFTLSRGESVGLGGTLANFTYDFNGTGEASVWQNVEDVTLFNSKEFTVSAKLFFNSLDPIAMWIDYNYGDGGSTADNLQHKFVYTPTSLGLQTVSFSFTTLDITGKTIGANSFFRVALSGANATIPEISAPVSTTLAIFNMQLEEGSSATPFEYVSPQENLAACQRYYQKIDATVPAQLVNSTDTIRRISFARTVTMRAAPTSEGGTEFNGTFVFAGAAESIDIQITGADGASTTSITDYFADAEL